MDTKDYNVKIEGFMLGDWQKKNSTITLNERQARDFLREGRIVEKGTKAASKPSSKPDAKAEPKTDAKA